MRARWVAILLTISLSTACDNVLDVRDGPIVVTPSSLIAQSNRLNDNLSHAERVGLVKSLADLVDADPVAAVDRFERDIGGGGALGLYARAMLDDGEAARLGHQLASVMRDGNPNRTIAQALSVSEPRDGSAWFRAAEKAGFFAGGIAGAFDDGVTAAEHVAAFVRALGVTAPGPDTSMRDWLRACGTENGCGLSGAADAAYQRGLSLGYR